MSFISPAQMKCSGSFCKMSSVFSIEFSQLDDIGS